MASFKACLLVRCRVERLEDLFCGDNVVKIMPTSSIRPNLPAFITLCTCLTTASAQIDVVFEHLFNEEGPLPILKAQKDLIPDLDVSNGNAGVDSYGGLERYDGDRLLLAVRENGINESQADHDTVLAAEFPDRSLIWINVNTGAPMGVALEVGYAPVELDQDFIAAGGSTIDYYFTFTVDDAGVVYANYKNKIVRYAPDGEGGFSAPTVAYTHANDGSERWYQWRFETLRASGTGSDTVIIAGGKTWRPSQGYRELVTADGLTFTATEDGNVGFKGGSSSIVPALFGETATQEWVYGTFYPGGSNGVDTKIVRNVRDIALDEPFGGSTFDIQIDEEIGYLGRFFSDTDVHPKFPYLVSYSTPSWNSSVVGVDPAEGGWIAIHDQFTDALGDPEFGEDKAALLAVHRIVATEAEEFINPSDEAPSSIFHGTLGQVTINVLPGMRPGQAEVLWHSGIYGYGRYILDFAPKQIEVTSVGRVSAEEASISWTSEVGIYYRVETSSSLEADSWQVVNASVPGVDGITSLSISVDAAQTQNFVRVGLGSVFAEDFESGAEGWITATLDEPFPDSGNTQWELGTPINVGPEMAHSGSNVYGTNIGSNYAAFSNITLASPVVDLSGVERATLKFLNFVEASETEGGQVRVLNEAGDQVLAVSEVYNSTEGGWQEVLLSLLRFGDTQESVLGGKVRFEFRFLSDDNTDDDGAGWYIDDLIIE